MRVIFLALQVLKSGFRKRTKRKRLYSPAISEISESAIDQDPVYLHDADYVVMESTYGDRSHGERPDYVKCWQKSSRKPLTEEEMLSFLLLQSDVRRKCCILSDRSKKKDWCHGHDGFKVYVDSPLANEATTIFSSISMTVLMKKRWN